MSTKFLIYPLCFDENDFQIFKEYRNKFTALSFDKLSCLVKCHRNVIYYLAKSIIDIDEILSNKNTKGYRYNSYLLNIIVLKLEYIVELMIYEKNAILKDEIELIRICIRDLKLILVIHHDFDEA